MPYTRSIEKITIRGILLPSDWDKHGKAIRLSLNTFQEEEYLISKKGIAKQLFSQIGMHVVITGTVEPNQRGQKVIVVENYQVE